MGWTRPSPTCHAELDSNLGRGDGKHLEAAAQVLVPCCTYKLSEDVRAAAVDAMPELLRAVKAGGDGAMLNGLWSAAWMELAKASVEPDPDAQRAILESIAACVLLTTYKVQ